MKTTTNTQHTPGPWRFEPETKTIRSVPANYWLATMDSWDGAVNNEANARLMASAPELLEALKLALAQAKHYGPTNPDELGGKFACDVIRQCDAAIAKAEGRT